MGREEFHSLKFCYLLLLVYLQAKSICQNLKFRLFSAYTHVRFISIQKALISCITSAVESSSLLSVFEVLQFAQNIMRCAIVRFQTGHDSMKSIYIAHITLTCIKRI